MTSFTQDCPPSHTPVLLTGDRPSGPLHLGHYVGTLKSRIDMQSSHEAYIMIADMQALTDYFEKPDHVHQSVFQVAEDYLAVGLDPERCTFFIQSQIPELNELSMYYLNLVTVSRLMRNPTVKAEIVQKNMAQSLPAGFLCYPVSQAADITAFGQPRRALIVPVGEDQLPMIEQSNEIVRRFNHIYDRSGEGILQEAQAYLSQAPRLVGIDGCRKASKSLGNAIFLNESSDVVREKVFSMYTDPGHIHVKDPGKVEGNVVFAYLDVFHDNKEEIDDMKAHYEKGGLGDITLKKILFNDIESLLEPVRERRAKLSLSHTRAILEEGTRVARQRVKTMVERVRQAIGLCYF